MFGIHICVSLDGVRKAKTWLELNFASDTKNIKKGLGFYRYTSQKRKVKESVPLR